jgi:hypothetical protein
MSGYVNLAVRRDAQVKMVVAYTGALCHFFNPRLYEGQPEAVDALLNMYGDCPEVTERAARSLAPFNDGLVVLDFDGRTVLDMQPARNLRVSSALFGLVDQTAEFHLIAGSKGWLGSTVIDVRSGKSLASFDHSIFATEATLSDWCDATKASLREPNIAWHLRTLPAFKLSPPDWVFLSFKANAGASFRAQLDKMRYELSGREVAAWGKWERENSVPYSTSSQ